MIRVPAGTVGFVMPRWPTLDEAQPAFYRERARRLSVGQLLLCVIKCPRDNKVRVDLVEELRRAQQPRCKAGLVAHGSRHEQGYGTCALPSRWWPPTSGARKPIGSLFFSSSPSSSSSPASWLRVVLGPTRCSPSANHRISATHTARVGRNWLQRCTRRMLAKPAHAYAVVRHILINWIIPAQYLRGGQHGANGGGSAVSSDTYVGWLLSMAVFRFRPPS